MIVRLTTAQALILFLNQQYIEVDGKEQKLFKGIFTIFGHGNVLGLGQALEQDSGDLEVYQGRNEQGMAHAAVAYAKQNNQKQLMACTSSIGPGSANMITAASTATANNLPVLLLPGDTFATRQPDPALQQIEQIHDASITTNDAFRPVSKYWDRVSRPEQLMSALINAMRVLTDQADTGAVTLSLPQDVQGEAFDYPEYFFKKRVHRIERRKPTDMELHDALELMKKKKKPLIVSGGGVRYSESGGKLKEFAEKYHIPIAETQAGKGAVEGTFPLNLGGIGVTGNSASNQLAKEADLVIGIGTKFADFTTGSKELFQHHDVDFLTINLSKYHANKLDATTVVADAKTTLEELGDLLDKENYSSGYNQEIEEARKGWEEELNRLYHTDYHKVGYQPEVAGHLDEVIPEYTEALETSLTQTAVIGEINQSIADDSIIVGSSGSLPGDLQRMWVSRQPNTYHMEYGYSCMGYEVSGSLGVKMAEPNKEVYAMVGDGSYLMLHSELVTSIQEGLKLNIILFDNAGFGCINNLQMGNGMGSFGTEFRHRNSKTGSLNGSIVPVDFAQSAAGYGVKTYKVHTIEDLRYALEDSKKQDVSTLMDIKVLPKTMSDGYDAWWNVGVAETSKSESVEQAHQVRMKHLEQARKY
ncbi:3D-(3,5/4)-trihydroxycyclohexane-1,2-dione acylhydrolase (decyclizing) [Pontibacillus sp. HMF3514]|uniref:3D-(3,5/4)-trihydroxycyclohexane-1,2-dione acylhydrolase (decyclizing) n=1 Tax=Pontibacillus sp. HMF3514 TaxID=2692425 RepID=UPI00131F651E|nr:3D-(3,5/4)-trihydroxycyclohexane-1,2-dione acylhydrolase (decyclizing) [Pontibacillus sp. HMF3514]QHE51703.1 3D-(3,5/4)-trihydroxycyclohexane-1,2-dione acylhydrolase (decyclizing) [Pontibacillus sp. HMF3514]